MSSENKASPITSLWRGVQGRAVVGLSGYIPALTTQVLGAVCKDALFKPNILIIDPRCAEAFDIHSIYVGRDAKGEPKPCGINPHHISAACFPPFPPLLTPDAVDLWAKMFSMALPTACIGEEFGLVVYNKTISNLLFQAALWGNAWDAHI